MQLQDRIQIERDFGSRLNRLFKDHRDRLADDLDFYGYPGGVAEERWEEYRREQEELIAALLLLVFGLSAQQHVGAGGFRYAEYQPQIEAVGRNWSRQRGEIVSRAMIDTTRNRLERKFQDAAQPERSEPAAPPAERPVQPVAVAPESPTIVTPELDARAVNEILSEILSQERAEFVGMAETTAAQTAGGETGVHYTIGISIRDRWRNNPGRLPGSLKLSRTGPCPVCKPMDGVRRLGWIDPRGPGPWIHPGCVCNILYANLPEGRETSFS